MMQEWRENAKVTHYDLINYTNVWGNETDGWEVNNLCKEIEDISITEDSTDKEILDYLVSVGFLTTSDMRQVYLQNDGEMIEIVQKKNNYPLGRLVLR